VSASSSHDNRSKDEPNISVSTWNTRLDVTEKYFERPQRDCQRPFELRGEFIVLRYIRI
jgi:hypothetical protein